MDLELVQYLDGRFQYLDERFERIEQRLDRHDRRFEGIDRRFDSIDQRFDEVKRHTGVLVEGLRHDVQLFAEGLDTFINVRYAQDQATIAEQFRETRALIRVTYDELRSAHNQLSQRVDTLERKPPN